MQKTDEDISLKKLFIPFTSGKAIHFLILSGFLVFFNGLFNGFVQDDHAQIVDKPTIHSLSNIASYFLESRLNIGEQHFIGAMYYKPMLDTVFALIYSVGGAAAFWFHSFQIVLATTNACLVFFFFKRFFTPVLSFILALVFLIHPINSESAFYISAMQEVLFFFFGITALLLIRNKYSVKRVILVSILLLFSLLSKETGILFVAISTVYTYLFQRNVWLQMLTAFGGMLFIYALLRTYAIGFFLSSHAVSPIETLTLGERILHIPSIIMFYVKTFFVPLAISSSHQWILTTLNFQNFYLPLFSIICLLIFLGIIGIYLYARDNKKWRNMYVFFSIWFLLGVSFHLHLLPLDQTVAERWFYFPIIGLLGIIGVLYSVFFPKVGIKNYQIKVVVFVLLGVVLFLLALRTFFRSFDFRNDFVLASADSKVSPESYNLHYILSRQYYDQGDLEKAKFHAEKSIALFPQITNYTNLGAIYSRMGEYALARKSYIKALDYGDDVLPYENIASVSLVYGDKEENSGFLKEKALKQYPKNGKLWFSLALLEYNNGNKKDALVAIEKAKHYYPIPLVQFIGEAFKQNKIVEVKAENGMINFSVK